VNVSKFDYDIIGLCIRGPIQYLDKIKPTLCVLIMARTGIQITVLSLQKRA